MYKPSYALAALKIAVDDELILKSIKLLDRSHIMVKFILGRNWGCFYADCLALCFIL